MEKFNCERVDIECYSCGHIFDMDLDLYIRTSSIRCPNTECEQGMAKYPNEFCEEFVTKDWLDACWEKQQEETSSQ